MGQESSSKSRKAFVVEQQGELAVVIPQVDLRELNYEWIEQGAREVLELLDASQIKHVIVDFHNTDYYGSTALGFFLKVFKRARSRGGQMVFCNVSEHEKEILQITGLNHLWPICATREAALTAINK